MENEPWKPLYTACICQMIGRKMRRTLKNQCSQLFLKFTQFSMDSRMLHDKLRWTMNRYWVAQCFDPPWAFLVPSLRIGLKWSQLSAAGAGAESLMSFSRRKPQTSRPVAFFGFGSGVPDAQSWDNWATPCCTADRKRFQSVVKRCSKSLIPDGSANAFPFSLICSSPSAHVKLFGRLPSVN